MLPLVEPSRAPRVADHVQRRTAPPLLLLRAIVCRGPRSCTASASLHLRISNERDEKSSVKCRRESQSAFRLDAHHYYGGDARKGFYDRRTRDPMCRELREHLCASVKEHFQVKSEAIAKFVFHSLPQQLLNSLCRVYGQFFSHAGDLRAGCSPPVDTRQSDLSGCCSSI